MFVALLAKSDSYLPNEIRSSTNKENHRANKEALKALLISSMTIYIT